MIFVRLPLFYNFKRINIKHISVEAFSIKIYEVVGYSTVLKRYCLASRLPKVVSVF